MITRALALACAILGALAVLQSYRLAGLKQEIAEERAQSAQQTLAAVEAVRLEEQRRVAAVQEVADEANQRAQRARADAAAARTAAERLRQALAAAAPAACGDPAVADGGEAARAARDLFADVQRRLDDAADDIAGFADQAHTAGRACERAYERLTPPVESAPTKE